MIRFREQASLYRTSLDQAVLAALQGCHFIITISGPANLALLEKHKIYSALDMFNAFESCQLEPNSRDFFAFSSPSGQQFRYKRLPQGFCNSPAIMSHLTSELLANLPTSSREAKLGQLAADTSSSDQSKHGAGQHRDKSTVPSDTSVNTPRNTPQTHPRIKPMHKTTPSITRGR